MKLLAQRALRIEPSQTVAIDAKYKQLAAAGADIISFGAGEPDFETPEHAKKAAIDSIQAGFTRYTQVTGIPALKTAICKKLLQDNALTYAPEQITVCSGSKHALFNALLALVEEGDEVLIPAPYWVTYPELVRLAGGTPIILPTTLENEFKITAAQLNAAITPHSKLLILNSPNNPSGAVYSKSELFALAEVLIAKDLYCLSDEIYEYIVYDEHKHYSIAAVHPEMLARSVIVNGLSKAYAMTGWRIGYVAAPKPIAKAIAAIQSHGTHHPANVSQYAALACITGDQNGVQDMVKQFAQRREFVLQNLAQIPELKVFAPQGAFYAFFNIKAYLGKSHEGILVNNSLDLCNYLLDKYLVVLVPGSGFGLEGYLRMSYASSLSNLKNGLERLAKALRALQ